MIFSCRRWCRQVWGIPTIQTDHHANHDGAPLQVMPQECKISHQCDSFGHYRETAFYSGLCHFARAVRRSLGFGYAVGAGSVLCMSCNHSAPASLPSYASRTENPALIGVPICTSVPRFTQSVETICGEIPQIEPLHCKSRLCGQFRTGCGVRVRYRRYNDVTAYIACHLRSARWR